MHPRRLLLLLVLLAPTAWAAAGSGTFRLDGGAFLPQTTDARFEPLFALNQGGASIRGLQVEASTLKVHRFEETFLGPPLPNTFAYTLGEPRRTVDVYTDARLSLVESDSSGYVGLYAARGSSARFQGLGGVDLEARNRTLLEHPASSEEVSTDPFRSGYVYHVDERLPHVAVEGAGIVFLDGAAFVKLYGIDVRIDAAEGGDTVRTGEERSQGVEHLRRWAILEIPPDARLVIESTQSWLLAGDLVSVSWSGAAVFKPAEGSFRTREGDYVPDGGTVRLAGTFTARFSPEVEGESVRTLLEVEGDVEGTTLAFEAAPGTAHGSSVAWPLLVVGVALGAGGAYAAWLLAARRSRAAEPLKEPARSLEECLAAATSAADDEDWERAAEWLRHVRRMAPTSARACADLAHALCRMGRAEEGLRLYEEASRLSTDGEADFNGAVAALEAGRPPEEVEAWLERALARTPIYVVDVESDPMFAPLKGRARFEAVLAEAWRRVEDADASDGAPASAEP